MQKMFHVKHGQCRSLPSSSPKPIAPYPVDSPAGAVLTGGRAVHQPRRRPGSTPLFLAIGLALCRLLLARLAMRSSRCRQALPGRFAFSTSLAIARYSCGGQGVSLVIAARIAKYVWLPLRQEGSEPPSQGRGCSVAERWRRPGQPLGRSGKLRFNAAVTPFPAGGLQCFT